MTKEEMLLLLASLSTEQLQAIQEMTAQLNAHSPKWLDTVCHDIQDKKAS